MKLAEGTITQRLPARQARYGSGPLKGVFVRHEKRLHEFDKFQAAGQIKRLITIGRLRSCNIQLADSAVSRLHCEIERRQDGTCIIVDADSENGVYVNDVQVTRAELRPGMWIHLGGTELIAVGTDEQRPIPIIGRSYTSFLANARDVHGTAETAAGVIHRSAATIYRAIQRLRERCRST